VNRFAMSKLNIFTVALSALFAFALGQGIGTQLSRTALLYYNLPLTASDAISAGWYNATSCDPNIGIAYTQNQDGPSKGYPITLFFSESGQISGMGMTHYGQPVDGVTQYWVPDSNGNAFMSVSFRDPSAGVCTPNNPLPETLGTQVVINQGAVNFALPLNNQAAAQAQWTAGGCIGKMGTHWSYDLKTAPIMSWVPSNLLPVVAMYNNDTGDLSAFFFTTPNLQYSEPLGPWEGPIPDGLMCLNWCSSECDFGVSFWNTLHFFIIDPSLDVCNYRCASSNSTEEIFF